VGDVAKIRIHEKTIETVVQKYAKMVYKLAYARTGSKSDADDIFQEAFLRYIRYGKGFENDEHEKAWLIRVTINCCNDLYRNRSIRKEEVLFAESMIMNDSDQEVKDLLLALPEKYRTVLHLHYFEDMRISDIAELLELSDSAVKMQLSRARTMLKENIERGEENVQG
jgi:RNA polymerase sigma-70 factor (ECF subfamily)